MFRGGESAFKVIFSRVQLSCVSSGRGKKSPWPLAQQADWATASSIASPLISLFQLSFYVHIINLNAVWNIFPVVAVYPVQCNQC